MQLIFNVADIIFSITADLPEESVFVSSNYEDFICKGDPFIKITGRYGSIDKIDLIKLPLIFDSGMNWSLYKKNSKHLFILKVPSPEDAPFCVAEFDNNYRKGTIQISTDFFKNHRETRLPFPLIPPLSEVFMVCFLAQERGLLIHACGINDGGKGYLFAGNSGHGKSTTADIWKDKATILNDDRIVIRFRDRRFWMYGTPWHGDYTETSPEGVPLEAIYFLQHGNANKMTSKSGVEAAAMLLARAFPPFWDAKGMEFSLKMLDDIVSKVPCHELSFIPDEDIVDFVRCEK